MSIIKEFKEFAAKGNVIDLAVGVIIGAAFGKIVTSLVEDVIMPPIGFLLSGIDFANLTFLVKEGSNGAPSIVIKYGLFINTVINFLIVAACIFMVVKLINRNKKKQEAEAPKPEVALLTEIRDELRKQ
jgi:large conductance mechanosensitive channel